MIVRCTTVLPFTTGLPRDVAENVTHWAVTGTPGPDDFGAIAGALEVFYNLGVDAPGQDWDGLAIKDYLSPIIDRAENACHFRFHEAKPNKPYPLLDARTWTLADSTFDGADEALPNELAVCLSLLATPALPVLLRNRRGRMYIGPLNSVANGQRTAGGVTQYSSPSTIIRHVIAEAATRMTSPTDAFWQIYSRVLDEAFTVSGGFVDNEWDVQRRRGLDADVRTTWSMVP